VTGFATRLQQGNAWAFVPPAIVRGALPGLEPGHSKTLMAASLLHLLRLLIIAALRPNGRFSGCRAQMLLIRHRNLVRLFRVAQCVIASALLAHSSRVWADDPPTSVTEEPAGEPVALHGQLTYLEQHSSAFHAPYRGPNSLSPNVGRETFDLTMYLGAKLWTGAEAWINPEIDQGFGLDNTLGVAGFPSGEAYKVGSKKPYFRLQRAFIRQDLDLDGEAESIDGTANQLRGIRSTNRIVLTVGKFAVTDVFDTNQYAHDPRTDFLNWTAVDAGSFDYAADAWGYTVGAAVEWYQGPWTLRGGLFDLSDVPNSEHLDPGGHQFQMILELERRYSLWAQPGRIYVTGYDSRGRMGVLDDAVQQSRLTGEPADIAAVRRYRSRVGVHLGVEQQFADDLGAFARFGGAAGNVEAYEFTDVDRAIQMGLSLRGSRWERTQDTAGLAVMVNDISAARRRFLDAGGLGILVGDGRLPHPGPEQILETYYSLHLLPMVFVTLDYQWINHPAYNRDRGPVSVFAVRLHAQF
jgi:high affinity Mn2+ porin